MRAYLILIILNLNLHFLCSLTNSQSLYTKSRPFTDSAVQVHSFARHVKNAYTEKEVKKIFVRYIKLIYNFIKNNLGKHSAHTKFKKKTKNQSKTSCRKT